MQRTLKTANINGYLNFITNLIEISKYEQNIKSITENLLTKDFQTMVFTDKFEENIISLIYHEITHFLDMTTTLWGLEYNSRKLLFIKNQILSKKKLDSIDVFKLNVSEIEIHNRLIQIYDTSQAKDLFLASLKHHLVYDKNFGSLIMIDFFNQENLIASVPFSMLSLLEANAISSEFLIRINCALNEEQIKKQISLKLIEDDFYNLLNNYEFLEYNLIFILTKKHFPCLNLKELLIFVKTLIDYILNISSMEISLISTLIKHTIINQYLGNAIVKDMQRGMSRHIVLFKFILMIYEYINQDKFQFNNPNDIKKNPKLFLKNFINEYISYYLKDFEIEITRDIEYQSSIKEFKKFEDILDSKIILESCQFNRNVLSKNFLHELNIKDIKLIDIFLKDGSILKMPNSINVDIEQYFDNNLELISKIDKLLETTDMFKFHIHPGDVTYV